MKMAKVHISSIGPKVDPLQVISSPPSSLLVISDSSTATAATDTPSSSSSATVVVVTGKAETTTCSTVPPSTTLNQQHHEQAFELLRMLSLPCHKFLQFQPQSQLQNQYTCRCKSFHQEYISHFNFGHSFNNLVNSFKLKCRGRIYHFTTTMPCFEHMFQVSKSMSNKSKPTKTFTSHIP